MEYDFYKYLGKKLSANVVFVESFKDHLTEAIRTSSPKLSLDVIFNADKTGLL